MWKLARFLKPYKKQLVLGPLAKLIEAICELFLPLLMAILIDLGINNNNKEVIIKMSLIMLAVVFVGLLCALSCQYLASVVSQKFGTEMRNALMKKINTFSHAEIDYFGTSTLTNRSITDINHLQLAVAMLIRLAIRSPFLCVGGCVMVMTIDLRLSIVLLTFIPVFVFVLYLITKLTFPIYRSVQKKLDLISTVIRENLRGVRVVRAFARSEKEKLRFSQANAEWLEASLHAGKISALLSPLTMLIMNVATIAIVWYGGIRVNIGGLTQGELIAFINYIAQIMLSLIFFSRLTVIFIRASASAARVNEVLDTSPSIIDEGGIPQGNAEAFSSPLPNRNALPSPALRGGGIAAGGTSVDLSPAIEFKNVSYGYGGSEEYAIRNISFTVKKGQTVGIIGGTGSGKSTLIQLIPRFYDPLKGEVFINGLNVKKYKLDSLRRLIGYVPQKITLFSGTISYNIRIGNKDAGDSEVRDAAKRAIASEFIENMPKKYNSVVLQGGKNLSGGQKQRLSIARALVRNPKILILDDSSSALDYATDAALRSSLKQNKNGTVIIASQRVSSVRDSDIILVMDDGELVGTGTHDELLCTCPIYIEICKSQKVINEEALI